MKHINHTLVGLRGFLALSVVIFHIYGSAIIEKYITGIPTGSLLYAINYAGPLSVNLFFVISGYLIIKSLTTKKTLWQFFNDRIARIYPVFLTIHVIIFTMGPIIGYKWLDHIKTLPYILHFFYNLILLPGMLDLPIAQIVAWSLSYEAVFYLVAGIIFFVWHKPTAHNYLKYTFLTLAAFVCLIIFYYRPTALFFIVGVLVFLGETTLIKYSKANKAFYLSGVITLCLLYIAYNSQIMPLAVMLGLSFLFFITIINEYGLLSSLLRHNLMRYLGRISYSLYMWHTIIMFPLKRVMLKINLYIHEPALQFVIYAAITLILSIIVSQLSYTYIEVKFTKAMKAFWDRKRQLKLNYIIDKPYQPATLSE